MSDYEGLETVFDEYSLDDQSALNIYDCHSIIPYIPDTGLVKYLSEWSVGHDSFVTELVMEKTLVQIYLTDHILSTQYLINYINTDNMTEW